MKLVLLCYHKLAYNGQIYNRNCITHKVSRANFYLALHASSTWWSSDSQSLVQYLPQPMDSP